MNRRRQFVPDPYDLNPVKRYEKSRNFNNRNPRKETDFMDAHLENVESEDDESYLQRDKHGKVSNYFRPLSKPDETSSKSKTINKTTELASVDDTKERLTRLEAMLEKLVKREKDVILKPPTPPPPPPTTTTTTTKKEKDAEFVLEPRNHHFTTSMWINKIQEISVRNNYTEKATIQFMEKQMTGIIKAWYKSLPNYDFSWPEWKLLITKTFPDNDDFVTTLKRLVTRIKQANETMTNYYYSKMYLIEACKITGEDAVSCLIDGLNNQTIQAEAKAQNYLTPETLCSQYLMNLPDYQVDYSPQDTFQTSPPPPPPPPQSQAPTENLTQYFYQNPGTMPETPCEPIGIQASQAHSHHQTIYDYPDNVNNLPANTNLDFNNFNGNLHFDPSHPINQPEHNFEERPPVHSRLGGKSTSTKYRRSNRSYLKSKPMNRRLV